jgi:hypothetical protein
MLMTTLSIVAGLIPPALGIGAGSSQRSAIAVTNIGAQTPMMRYPTCHSSLFCGRFLLQFFEPVLDDGDLRCGGGFGGDGLQHQEALTVYNPSRARQQAGLFLMPEMCLRAVRRSRRYERELRTLSWRNRRLRE